MYSRSYFPSYTLIKQLQHIILIKILHLAIYQSDVIINSYILLRFSIIVSVCARILVFLIYVRKQRFSTSFVIIFFISLLFCWNTSHVWYIYSISWYCCILWVFILWRIQSLFYMYFLSNTIKFIVVLLPSKIDNVFIILVFVNNS